MQKIVSITSQGQVTIPQSLLKQLGITGSTKALIRKKNDILEVIPKKDFWSLEGFLKSDIVLTDDQLKQARGKFSQEWSK